jgi:hypothetical protein
MKTKTFHVSNFGSFGGHLPCDSDGYCHLTIKGWSDAGYSVADARELAATAKEAVKEAEVALATWQEQNA